MSMKKHTLLKASIVKNFRVANQRARTKIFTPATSANLIRTLRRRRIFRRITIPRRTTRRAPIAEANALVRISAEVETVAAIAVGIVAGTVVETADAADDGAGVAEDNAAVDVHRVVRAEDAIYRRLSMPPHRAEKLAATILVAMRIAGVSPAVLNRAVRGNVASMTGVRTTRGMWDPPRPPTVLEPLKILTLPRSVFFSPVNRWRNTATNRWQRLRRCPSWSTNLTKLLPSLKKLRNVDPPSHR
jgi:hypothetical protein